MPSVRAMSAMRAADTIAQQRERGAAGDRVGRDHRDGEQRQDDRVRGDPQPQAEPTQQRAGEEDQEADARDVHDRRVAGQEPGKVRGVGELRAGAVEDEEVGELAAQRREDLVGEDQRDEPGREQPPQRRPADRSSAGVEIAGPARARGRPQPVRIRRPVAQTSPANAAWARAVASSRSSVRPSHGDELPGRAGRR